MVSSRVARAAHARPTACTQVPVICLELLAIFVQALWYLTPDASHLRSGRSVPNGAPSLARAAAPDLPRG